MERPKRRSLCVWNGYKVKRLKSPDSPDMICVRCVVIVLVAIVEGLEPGEVVTTIVFTGTPIDGTGKTGNRLLVYIENV